MTTLFQFFHISFRIFPQIFNFLPRTLLQSKNPPSIPPDLLPHFLHCRKLHIIQRLSPIRLDSINTPHSCCNIRPRNLMIALEHLFSLPSLQNQTRFGSPWLYHGSMILIFVQGVDPFVVFPGEVECRTGGYGGIVTDGTCMFSNMNVTKGYHGATVRRGGMTHDLCSPFVGLCGIIITATRW